ncbi:SGNH/GDSL hydrolase family protein [bacterium]|nr:SGNH/GDSL hydrolase family protein [bacterium]
MKHFISHLLAILLLSIFILSFSWIWHWCSVDPKSSKWPDIINHDNHLDCLLIGSSHVQRSLSPTIFHEYTQQTCFNVGTGSQPYDASLLFLQEAIKHHQIKTVYLEMYHHIWTTAPYSQRTDLNKLYAALDGAPWTIDKITTLLHASHVSHYVNSFLPVRRFALNIFNLPQDKEYFLTRLTALRRPQTSPYIADYGFLQETKPNRDRLYVDAATASIDITHAPSTDSYRTLQQIAQLAHQHGINLVLFMQPELPTRIYYRPNYQAYHDMIADFADEYHLPFYDFNFVKASYFDVSDPNLFYADDHLTVAGAEKFSQLFGQLISGEVTADDIFYPDLATTIQQAPPAVYGIARQYANDQVTAKLVAHQRDHLAYQVYHQAEGSHSAELLLDWTNQEQFTYPATMDSEIVVTWHRDNDEHQFVLPGWLPPSQ